MAWAFPDSGAQVTLIGQAMVSETEGAFFIVVTRKDNGSGLERRTFQGPRTL